MSSEVLVCVLGPSRGQGHAFNSDEGVGKSCLCYRFVHPGFDDYVSDHPSLLALHEFESPAINSVHFLYWGCKKQTFPGRLGKAERTVTVHVVENTVLYQDVTSQPFKTSGSGKADNIDAYVKRALGRMECRGKMSYWTRDAISLPDTYRAQRYPSNVANIKKGYIVVVDVNMTGTVFDAQLQRAKKICQALKKGNHEYVIAATKMESANSESLEQLHQMRKKLRADLISTSASCNYNITAAFRNVAGKVIKNAQEEIPTFEQAAGKDLDFKSKAKRSFKNFTTKWVHTSTERLEDIELTEQYRACKSAVGKYETDRIFVCKLLEKKNQEMMVGINDDPERRREFLEDFLEDHPDVVLYRTYLQEIIDQYVTECEEHTTTQEDSPRTPRRVHHFTSDGIGPSSSTSSPSRSKVATHTSTSSSCSSPGLWPVATADIQPDSTSIGSFESEDEMTENYVNLEQFTGGKQPPASPLTLTTSPSPSSPTLPMVIPSLKPGDTTGKEEDPANQAANEADTDEPQDAASLSPTGGKRRQGSSSSTQELSNSQSSSSVAGGEKAADARKRSKTHEWVSFPRTRSSSSVGGGEEGRSRSPRLTHELVTLPRSPGTPTSEASANETEAESEFGTDGGAVKPVNRDGPFNNGAKEGVNQDGMSNDGVWVTNQDGPLDIDTVYENLTPSPIHKSHDQSHDATRGPTVNPPEAPPTSGANETLPPSSQGPGSENQSTPSQDTERQMSKHELPFKRRPPPPTKPKPKTSVQRMTERTGEVDVETQTAVPKPTPPVTPSSVDESQAVTPKPTPPLMPPSTEQTKAVVPSHSLPPTAPPQTYTTKVIIPVTFRPLQSADSEERASTPSDSLRSRLLSEESVASSGEEYVPTDDEGSDLTLKKEDHEPTPVEDRSESPPPAIPMRTKNYHKVVLPVESSNTVTPHSSPEKGSQSSRSLSPSAKAMASPPLEMKIKYDITPENKTNSLPGKNKRRFYERWKLKKGESSKSDDSVEQAPSPLPNLPVSVPKNSPAKKAAGTAQKKEKANAKVKKSHSHRQKSRSKSPLQRQPSDPTRSTPPPPSGSPMPPRQTFLNMRTRPLPQEPFALSPEEYVDHDAWDYEKVYTQFNPPASHPLPPRSDWPNTSPVWVNTPPSQRREHPPLQRNVPNSEGVSDYVNDDQFPRPTHLLSPAMSIPPTHVQSPPSFFAANPVPPSLRHAPFSTPYHPSHSTSSLNALSHSNEPAHSLLTPHPLPRSTVQPPHSLPPRGAVSKPPSGNNVQSPEYDYPLIPGMMGGRMLPLRSHMRSHPTVPISVLAPSVRGATMTKSRSSDFEHDEYVEMTGVSHQKPKDDQEDYQNWDVIKAIKVKRSQSLEDIHLYKNLPLPGRQPTFMTQPPFIPLPPRQMQPGILQCVVPPRNIPRPGPQGGPESSLPLGQPLIPATVNPTHRGSLDTLLETSHDSSFMNQATVLPAPNLPPSPSQLPRHSGQLPLPLQPVPNPRRKILRTQSNDPEATLSNPLLISPDISLPPHTLMQLPSMQRVALGSPPLQKPQQSPPHMEYVPKFSQPPLAPQIPLSSVGTSTWTTENDPSSDYYNVVSKAYFTPPRSVPTTHQYLDICPD